MSQAFTGKHPLSELNSPSVMLKIMNGERPIYPSGTEGLGFVAPVWNMTVDCWRDDPVFRPTMAAVVEFLREWSVVPLRRTNTSSHGFLYIAIPNTLRTRHCPNYLRGSHPGIRSAHRFMDPSHRRPQMVTSVRPDRRAPHQTPPFRSMNNLRARRLTSCPPDFCRARPLHLANRSAMRSLPVLLQVIVRVLLHGSSSKIF